MLSTFEIRTLDVPGSVVVMTGCATAPSDVKAGLGLAGLVRAWTVAGASAVVATEWAVQDSTGSSLLGSFYRHLRDQGGVAEALRLAQMDMIHSGTAESAPAVWAAYQVFGGQLAEGSQAQ
jgi:CHAT domain-containing protein